MSGIILREREKSQSLVNLFKKHKLNPPYFIPAIFTLPIDNIEIPPISQFDWIIFTSPRAVKHFSQINHPLSETILIASIGKATTDSISKWLKRDINFESCHENALSMTKEFLYFLKSRYTTDELKQLKIIQPTSNISGDTIRNNLKSYIQQYTKLEIYRTIPNPLLEQEIKKISVPLKYIVLYSPSGVNSLCNTTIDFNQYTAISIGPVTTKILQQKGFKHIKESKTPHPEDIFNEILNLE